MAIENEETNEAVSHEEILELEKEYNPEKSEFDTDEESILEQIATPKGGAGLILILGIIGYLIYKFKK